MSKGGVWTEKLDVRERCVKMSEERKGMRGEDMDIRGDGSLPLVVLLFSLHSLSKNSHLSLLYWRDPSQLKSWKKRVLETRNYAS